MRPPSLRDLRVLDADFPRGLVVCSEGNPPVASAHDEQDDNTNTRTPVHGLSTVPFPTGGEEPQTYDDDWVLELGADSKYSIYKNFLDLIWAEAKSQQNHGVRQKIIRYSTLKNDSKLSSNLAALVSAMDSQEDLREIASELSLEDNKIVKVLCADRKHIKALLLITQLNGEEIDNSCLLDLAQDVLDSLPRADDLADTTLHRLIVKLSFSCGRLPSSLFIKGVEQDDNRLHAGGSFGNIYKAVYRSKVVALKQLRFNEAYTEEEKRKIQKKFCQEALLWKNLQHPNILPFLGLHSKESDPNDPLSILWSMFMVCEWMPKGTVLKYVKESPSAPINVLLLEIAEGLRYLHSKAVLHGDLRGNNILVDEGGHARLADFGLACYANATAKSSTHAGSTRWMAPELLEPGRHFQRTLATDVYAFSCVCYELYNGAPFAEQTNNKMTDAAVLLAVVVEGRRPLRLSTPSRIWKVVEESWCKEPESRLKIGEIVERLKRIQQEDIAAGTSARTEPQPRYRPPGALGITLKQNANSTLALTWTAPVTVTVAPNVRPPNRTRRHSFFELFRGPSADHAQLNWRDAPRALAGFLRKGKTVTYPSPAQPAEMSSVSAGNALIKRPRFLSSPAR
ncbi:kinase-like domain-containing protein [Mycena metata]|uniref:Kinase-like domain-containing protein n=1 Tax=Mycena metata TaxID=1033252 RepID=A0AAD7H5W6_9AGAR|nr:kinase-like domain-containing protein [Mycena metata]